MRLLPLLVQDSIRPELFCMAFIITKSDGLSYDCFLTGLILLLYYWGSSSIQLHVPTNELLLVSCLGLRTVDALTHGFS